MALLETKADFMTHPEASNASLVTERYPLETTRSIRTMTSTRSLRSIRSLREIPLVNTSYDGDYDTMLGDRPSNLSVSSALDATRESLNLSGNTHSSNRASLPAATATSSPRAPTVPESPWKGLHTNSRRRTHISTDSQGASLDLEHLFIEDNLKHLLPAANLGPAETVSLTDVVHTTTPLTDLMQLDTPMAMHSPVPTSDSHSLSQSEYGLQSQAQTSSSYTRSHKSTSSISAPNGSVPGNVSNSNIDGIGSAVNSSNSGTSVSNTSNSRDAVAEPSPSPSVVHNDDNADSSYTPVYNERMLMDDTAKCAGALASMKDFLETWAPSTYCVVTAAAALQRDSAAFASALASLLSEDIVKDPAYFSSQFYQLREAYSSLLTLGDSSTVTYGQQGWNSVLSMPSSTGKSCLQYNKFVNDPAGLESSWDERQLVDSLMTLLRTSPGFLASAISKMNTNELKAFCSEPDNDRSPLNILFHGILGSAKTNRPRVFAEVLRAVDQIWSRDMRSRESKIEILVNAVLQRFASLAVGTLTKNAQNKLERFFRQCLDTHNYEIPDFSLIVSDVLPEEFIICCECILHADGLRVVEQIREIVLFQLQSFVKHLISNPHAFGLIDDIFISPQSRSFLLMVSSQIYPSLDQYINTLTERRPKLESWTDYWQQNELIAVKGSDIVLLYKSLLPSRTETTHGRPVSGVSAQSHETQDSEGDEWCLDSIREDLVPVIEGLSHSIRTRVDGWQIFKIGEDGLVTDLGSDMGLDLADTFGSLSPQIQALCSAISLHEGDTLSERLEYAKQDARLQGDYLTLLDLQDADRFFTPQYVRQMNENVESAKLRCKSLRRMLDRAAKDQRSERERLSKLLAILDNARIHVWYEAEVRNGQAFYKSRQFLYLLYPKSKEMDEDRYAHKRRLVGPEKNALNALNLGFSFGLGTNSYYSNTPGNRNSIADTSSLSANSNGLDTSSVSLSRSRRLSLLSSHSQPESPFYQKPNLRPGKLNDKEVDVVKTYLRRAQAHNILQAEERFTRGLVETANLARKLIERDHLISYISFKKDRHYQSQYAQQQAQAQADAQRSTSSGTSNIGNSGKRNSHHNRRSSLGLFDFFDTSSHQNSIPLNLHTTTSTQFLGLAGSQDSLRAIASMPSCTEDGRLNRKLLQAHGTGKDVKSVGPPRAPSLAQVQALILSDIGHCYMHFGTDTDSFMQQTGRMLLEGESQELQPLLDDISTAGSPMNRLHALERAVEYLYMRRQRQQASRVSRSEIIQELSKVIGREPGTLYRDLQVISLLVNPTVLNQSAAFQDAVEAASIVIDTVVIRSMDYAARFLRYYMESTTTATPKMALMGINDSVDIWAFCARQGNRDAQEKLSELCIKFPHLQLDLKPLVKPSNILDGLDGSAMREAVSLHWQTLASRI